MGSIPIHPRQFGSDDSNACGFRLAVHRARHRKAAYNHFSLLRNNEQIFGFGYLGDANLTGVASVGNDVFNRLPNPAHGPGKVVLVELIGS